METTNTDRGIDLAKNRDKREYKGDDKVKPGKLLGIILGLSVVMFFVFLPVWPYAIAWGYYPALGFGLIFLIGLFFAVMGYAREKRDPRH